MSNFNSVDCIMLLIVAFSMLAGLTRGFMKEAISLVSWIAAAFVASTFAAPLASHFSGGAASTVQGVVGSSVNVSQPITYVALAISFIVLFIGTLFIGSIVGYMFSGVSSVSGLGVINRILGSAFGLARGLLVVIVVMFLCELTPVAAQEAWAQSQFVNSLQPYVNQFAAFVEPQLQSIKALGTSAVQGVTGQASGALQGFTGK